MFIILYGEARNNCKLIMQFSGSFLLVVSMYVKFVRYNLKILPYYRVCDG